MTISRTGNRDNEFYQIQIEFERLQAAIDAISGGGIAAVVNDTTPQLGGTLDANGQIIDMGANTITDTKVGQWDTAFGWGNHAAAGYVPDSRTITAGDGLSGGGNLSADRTLDLDISTLPLVTAAIDIDDQIVVWDSIDDAHRRMDLADLSAGIVITESQISDLGNYLPKTASVTSVGAGSGTTVIGSAQTGNVYYATTSLLSTRSFQLNSATVGTQIEVHRNGAGTVRFTQGTSQTIIQGNNWEMANQSSAKAICVAANTWSVVGKEP